MATPFSTGYRRLVYVTLAATFLVVAWGGIVRVTGSGLGCPDWPLCHGRLLPQLDPATQIEWLHRMLALVAGLGIAAVAAWTISRYRRHGALVWLSALGAAFFLLQAVLGAITVWLELPHTWVTAHLANAQVLLAILVTHAILVRWPNALAGLARPDRASWLALAAAAGTFVLILSGAYVRGDEATSACTTWPLCDEGAFPSAGPALVHMAHRYIAAAVGALVLLAALAAWRRRREIPGAG
ncbi:MAG: COX15/CtaA family protein, partial [Thermoleophilaceae bacterium]